LIPTTLTWQTVLTLIAAIVIGYLTFKVLEGVWKTKHHDTSENMQPTLFEIKGRVDGIHIRDSEIGGFGRIFHVDEKGKLSGLELIRTKIWRKSKKHGSN
jgi:hypothetical protein